MPSREEIAAALLERSAALLLDNGQTTEGTSRVVEHLSRALGCPVTLRARWGQVTLYGMDRGATFVDVEPAGVDIGRVSAAERIVDAVSAEMLDPAAALMRLDAIGRAPPVPRASGRGCAGSRRGSAATLCSSR